MERYVIRVVRWASTRSSASAGLGEGIGSAAQAADLSAAVAVTATVNAALAAPSLGDARGLLWSGEGSLVIRWLP